MREEAQDVLKFDHCFFFRNFIPSCSQKERSRTSFMSYFLCKLLGKFLFGRQFLITAQFDFFQHAQTLTALPVSQGLVDLLLSKHWIKIEVFH